MIEMDIKDTFSEMVGMPIWGLRRTHGSAIFIEFGKPQKRGNEVVLHGESHILSQLGTWRILIDNELVLGSDDAKEDIDKTLSSIEFGNVERIILNKNRSDISVISNINCAIEIFWFGLCRGDRSAIWTLYRGNKESWSYLGIGQIEYEG